MENKFPKGAGLKYVLMDACYEVDDDDEKESFQSAMETIWTLLEYSEDLPTTKVQEVETESKALKRKLEEKENLLHELEEER